jgi:hypothetical protein
MHLLRLPFRAEGDAGGAGEPKVDPPAGQKADEVSALKEQLAKLLAADAKRLDAEKKAADADAKKRGEHEQLLKVKEQEAAELADKVKGYEKAEAARLAKIDAANAKRIKEIPEIRRSLVPAALTVDALDDYLTTNWPLLKGDETSTGTRRATTGADDIALTPQIIADAAKHGMAPEKWAEILKKAGRIKPAATA